MLNLFLFFLKRQSIAIHQLSCTNIIVINISVFERTVRQFSNRTQSVQFVWKIELIIGNIGILNNKLLN